MQKNVSESTFTYLFQCFIFPTTPSSWRILPIQRDLLSKFSLELSSVLHFNWYYNTTMENKKTLVESLGDSHVKLGIGPIKVFSICT